MIRLSVEDTGVGLSEGDAEKVFEPFVQTNASDVSESLRGTGLGLAIVKRIVDRMRGEIHVQSEKGKGSRFAVDLPMAAAHPAITLKSEAKSKLEEVSEILDYYTPKILVLEDNEDNAMLLGHFLNRLGLTATFTATGGEALETIEGDNFDLLFLDIQLPDINGDEVTKIVRKMGIRQPYICGVTANAFAEDHQRYQNAGMDAVVSKPIKYDVFAEKVKLILNFISR